MIEVTCAIIIKNSEILAVQRGAESSHPFLWEFPGGKIHAEETADQCIVREIKEELSVEIEVLSRLTAVDFDYGVKQIRLIPFVCQVVTGEIELTEHISKCWFSLDEWQSISWSGADYELIVENQEKIRKAMDVNY